MALRHIGGAPARAGSNGKLVEKETRVAVDPNRTTKMEKIDLNALRTAASGTRRALTDATLEQLAAVPEADDAHNRPTAPHAAVIARPVLPRRLFALIAVSVVVLVLAAGAVGFVLGQATR